MNQAYGWMGGVSWMWAGLAILVVIVVVVKSLSRKRQFRTNRVGFGMKGTRKF